MSHARKLSFFQSLSRGNKRNRRSLRRYGTDALESRTLLSGQSIVLQNATDAHIAEEIDPNANMGGSPTLEFYATWVQYGGPANRSLLEFDLAPTGGAVPASAILELYQLSSNNYAGGDMAVEVYALTEAWEEGSGTNPWAPAAGVSWTDATTNDQWQTAGGDFNTTYDFGHGANGLIATATLSGATEDSWVSFDVTAAVAAWNSGQLENHGFITVITSGDYTLYQIASSEYSDSSLAPRLTVDQTPAPEISVSTTQLTVGESSGPAMITVSLAESPEDTVTVQYSTVDQTANAGTDYQPQSGTLTFPAGTQTLVQQVAIPIVDDTSHEPTESFELVIFSPVNAILGNTTATVTIEDNDERGTEPIILQNAIDTHLVPETIPNANLGGSHVLDFYATWVQWGGPAHRSLLEFDLSDVGDVVPKAATLELYQLPSEYYSGGDMLVELYALSRDWEEGSGLDPWAPSPGASWANASSSSQWLQPGGDYHTNFDFGNGANGLISTATLSPATADSWISFDVTSAVAAWNSGLLANHGFVTVIKTGDYTLYQVASSEYANSDLAPKLTIEQAESSQVAVGTSSLTVSETAGTAYVAVTLSETPTETVTVQYTTFNDTAMAVTDYMGTSGQLVFEAATTQLTQFVSIPIVNDGLHEPAEAFILQLNGAVNAGLSNVTAMITILDNDDPFDPSTLLVADAVVSEGEWGARQVEVVVTLLNGPTTTVTVDYETVDYTAEAGQDYTPTNGQLVFAPGQTSQTISVSISGDRKHETDEKFRIQLRNAVDAGVGDGSAMITIRNDDAADPEMLPFFDPSEFMNGYLGAFELPAGGANGEFGFGGYYGGLGLALRPNADGTGNTLYVTGENSRDVTPPNSRTYSVAANSVLAEVSIPSELATDPAQMQIATLFSHVDLAGMLEIDSRGQKGDVLFEGNGANYEIQIDDVLVVGDKLVVSAIVGYDVGVGASHSHFIIDGLDLDQITDRKVHGLFNVADGLSGQGFDGTDAGFVAGYMTEIPSEWQAALGGSHLLGQSGLSGLLRTSMGPSAFAFDASKIGTSDFQTPETLTYYPHAADWHAGETSHALAFIEPSHRPGPAIVDDPLYNWNATVEDVVFAPGTRSVLFFGSIGVDDDTGESFVGYGDSPVYNDYARGHYKGPHSLNGEYEYQVWAYDAYDYAKVRSGELAPWEVQPHDVWTFDFPGMTDLDPAKQLAGTAFDPATNRLYVAQQRWGDPTNDIPSGSPIVHVFQLGPPPNITASGSPMSGDGNSATEKSNVAQTPFAAPPADADFAQADERLELPPIPFDAGGHPLPIETSIEPADNDSSKQDRTDNDELFDPVGQLAVASVGSGNQSDLLAGLLDEINLAVLN